MRTAPVTNHLLRTAYRAKQDDDLTPLRVQKLLYFLHGWYSAITGTALLNEPFVRGKYGPKLASLDVDLAPYKGVPVGDYIREWNPEREKLEPFFVDMKALPQFAEVLEKVWKEYSKYTTEQLSAMSHGPGSPWARTSQDGAEIPQAWIADEFTRQAAVNRERAQKAMT